MIVAAMKKRKRARSGSPSLGCLFWTVLVVVMLALAWYFREPVIANARKLIAELHSAGGSAAQESSRQGPQAQTRPNAEPSVATRPSELESGKPAPAVGAQDSEPESRAPAAGKPSAPIPEPPVAGNGKPSAAAGTRDRAVSGAEARTERIARLYFVEVGDDGGVALVPVTRAMAASDSPLRDAIAALIAGPTSSESSRGLRNMIPPGTTLRSVTMRGNTALIDFSEGFRLNANGREGLEAGLRQVVWVATEFPTVHAVQVLIDGERVAYLGPEGVAVGDPLDRSSFPE